MTDLADRVEKLVIVETRFAGDIVRNVKYTRACMHDCLVNHNEYPIASHLLYTQSGILNDNDLRERKLGIDAGLAWGRHAQATIVYTDLGTSGGMKIGIENAQKQGRPVEYRTLGSNWESTHDVLVAQNPNHPFALNTVRM